MIEILTDRTVIQFSGEDAGVFLHAITTNNVLEKTYSYNYVLNRQGRYMFDMFIFKQDENLYLIDIAHTYMEEFKKYCYQYVLRSKVDIEYLSHTCCIVYSSDKVKDAKCSFRDPRSNMLGFRSVINRPQLEHMPLTTDNQYLNDRYTFGIVDGHIDLVQNKSLILDYAAEEFNAIDYDKGCYVGQEVIRKAKTYGTPKRRIFLGEFDMVVGKNLATWVVEYQAQLLGTVCSNHEKRLILLLREEKFLDLTDPRVYIYHNLAKITIPSWRFE